ncbi:hypothetical protein C0J52_09622 [Blattella germanica]|nr:hypothetical protein C0J52_09622 [Blattella germanica]
MDNTEEDNSDPMPKRRKVPVLPHDNVRKLKCGHMPEISDIKDWQKLRRSGCNSRTRTFCTTCKIFLCFVAKRNCFKQYHEN